MEVYTVPTIGGQITHFEATREILPNWLAALVSEHFAQKGFCFWRDPDRECIIYPTREAAERAINWAIEN